MRKNEIKQAIEILGELGSAISTAKVNEIPYGKELRRATAAKAEMQEETAKEVNEFLSLKRDHDEFYTTTRYRIANFAYLIRRGRISKRLLELYDTYSEKSREIDTRARHLDIQLSRVEEQESSERTNEYSPPLKPTLDELIRTYRQTSNSIDNSRRLIVETWQLVYPKKDFPRDVSGLYNGGAAKI